MITALAEKGEEMIPIKQISVDKRVATICDTLIVTAVDAEILKNIGRVIVEGGYRCKVFYEGLDDSVPVVRCKDCRYYDESREGAAGSHRCRYFLRWEPTDGFCHYAIRRQITAESE